MTDFNEYFSYLKTRSTLGQLYRRHWLYPRLCRQLSGKVLDIGFGLGDMLAFRPNTVGADVNPHAVAWAKQRKMDAHLILNGKLPFEDGVFDGVIMDNVLEHILNPQDLLVEVRRVLKMDGVFLVGVPGLKGFASDPDHKVFYDKSALGVCLSNAGFLMQRTFWMPLKWKWLDSNLSQYCLYGLFRPSK